ncbi:transporter substrate-binding domain-containing protein [Thalassomonas sp. RHCl1]|uniref:substrate-binding periplasmic protein n=1 Tax=Thalassomonas sp. RHCl1 TaxID=2995320 RepID=UPI00248CC815|nr:transporter substrate-binding domain-containing protein [Thalassomonas sp. RHCl1]
MIQNTPDQKVAAQVLKVIYQRLGIAVTFVELPGKRALVESSSGQLDAEAQRIYRIGELYPDLLRVPTSYMTWGVSVFSKKHNFKLTGWLSLKGYTVAMVRGMKYAEIGLRDAQVDNVVTLDDVGEMMKILAANRVDFAIASSFNGALQLKVLGIEDIGPLSPELSQLKLYHYLHKKHRQLLSKIDAVIKSMKRTGELKKLQQKFINELLNNEGA